MSNTRCTGETPGAAHLEIEPASQSNWAPIIVQSQMMRGPARLIGKIADAEIERGQAIGERLIDQVLQQHMTDFEAPIFRVVGRHDIVEPAAADETQMRRDHAIVA